MSKTVSVTVTDGLAVARIAREHGNAINNELVGDLIAMAHEIPYVATASVADVRDLEAKVTRAMSMS